MDIVHAAEEELFIQAAARIAASITRKEVCVLGIVGGRSTPSLLDKLLPHLLSWRGRLHVFWLDERVHADKNYVAALPYLERIHKDGVAISWYPLQNLHRPAMEVEVQQTMALFHALGGKFDIVILSAGEDGHIASLFPHHDTLRMLDAGYVFEENAPKAPPLRVTVTPALLTTAHEGFLFITGEKQHAYALFTDPHTAIDDCPARLLAALPRLTVFTTLR